VAEQTDAVEGERAHGRRNGRQGHQAEGSTAHRLHERVPIHFGRAARAAAGDAQRAINGVARAAEHYHLLVRWIGAA
jgi:hypothetical protein